MKHFNPTSPVLRTKTVSSFEEITKFEPEKTLLEPLRKTGGRNCYGRITTRYIGGGHKQFYRKIDFKRNKFDIPATVSAVEYDPNRSARIALLNYTDGEKRYIVSPVGLKVGDRVISATIEADIKPGNCLKISNIPVGTMIYNIEMQVGKGGQLVRSAGTSAQLVAKEEKYSQVKLPSGEVRKILSQCRATIGQVGNIDHENIVYGSAGRIRWLGRRPNVRGVAKNPVDHPHGGGEGKTSGGRHPVTPWGVKTKGFKTRNNKRTDKFIITRRK